ncbi:MAG: DUF1294 domain-containing protein [Clostridia bacterium]|nr:DUF1294 domain-containing protein [Clostridia bacterium]NCC68836.1 DUF1294 domain-containing protein [Clostridia bacterium]
MYFILSYLAVVNLDGFLLMGADKSRAKKNRRRIPEATMFLVAVLGGSLGVLLGMYAFRHKTLHTKFTVGIPLLLFFETVLTIVLIYLTL